MPTCVSKPQTSWNSSSASIKKQLSRGKAALLSPPDSCLKRNNGTFDGTYGQKESRNPCISKDFGSWSIPPRSRTFLHHCRSSIWNGCHDRPSEKSKFLLAIAKAMRRTNQIITKSIFYYIPELLWRKSMLQCIISAVAPTL